MPSYITNNLLCVMGKEINKTRKQAEKHSKDDKEINDYDYKRQADFEEEGDEEISGED
jgi:hypothetical protein